MANFHTNELVIVANEEDMSKVLVRFAQNLAANNEETRFDIGDIEGKTSVDDLWDALGGPIECWYWLIFTGAPIDRNDNVRVASSTAATARPMSDTGIAQIERYGDLWALGVSYDTAWRHNKHDINLFFMGLPSGNYGIAFFDADEGDGYDPVNTFSGVHHGRGGMRAAEVRTDEAVRESLLHERRVALSHPAQIETRELAELAELEAIRTWHFENEPDSDLEPEDELEDFDPDPRPERDSITREEDNLLDTWGFNLDWINLPDDQIQTIEKMILLVLGMFPWVVGSTGAAYDNKERNVERLIPGQPIRLIADWTSPHFRPCAIEVRDSKDRPLGYLDSRGGGMELSNNARSALACLLPHVRAYADYVEPHMIQTRKRHSKVIVRLELDDAPLESILDETRELLERASNQRTTSSIVEEG